MRFLITGINGFVGSYLAEYLLSKTNEVYGTVYPSQASENINHIINKLSLFDCDLSVHEEIEKVIIKAAPELIFHLAGQSNVPLSWENPVATVKVNILGTLYLLEAIKKHAPKSRVLIVGSGDEYGNITAKKPMREDTLLNPQNPYATTKMCAEIISAQYAMYNKLYIVRVRTFPHIGPRQSPNFVVSDFCRQIALIEKNKQHPIINVGNLTIKRDFTDVRDIVKAYWFAINKCSTQNVYNISSDRAYSINEILKKLLQQTKSKIKIKIDTKKMRMQDTPVKIGNSTKFRKATGWKPCINIDQTLKETLEWWRKQV